MSDTLQTLLAEQQAFFAAGETRAESFRREKLVLLRDALVEEKESLADALRADLHKPEVEIITGEIGYLISAIDRFLVELRRLCRASPVRTPLLFRPAKSSIRFEPYGPVLILGPWNVPLQLSLLPAIGAMAAGNTVVLKPSEAAPETSRVLEHLVNTRFPDNYFHVVQGDAAIAATLASMPFSRLFFTGSTEVGRKVYQAAAANLCPVTLELGGKNPCVVCADADIAVAARRIVYGKFYNTGQTCIAPDTVYVHRSVKPALLEEIDKSILRFFGSDPARSADYGRIINAMHLERLRRLLSGATILSGGEMDAETRYLSPTVVDEPDEGSPLATEEIFGPILPVAGYEDEQGLSTLLKRHSTPLALYIFTRNPAYADMLSRLHPAGGLVINDTISHVMNPNLPFGGVGTSGFGSYHADESWRTFTRPMPVLHRSSRVDLPLRYPPYSPQALGAMRRGVSKESPVTKLLRRLRGG